MENETGWTQERVDLVKRTVCPKGITDDEFALFLEQCKRSGLDPLLKEAFCVPRKQNIGTREQERWITKHEFQPAESGMLSRAERFPDFRGISASAVYAKDDISIDAGEGSVAHVYRPGKDRGILLGAWSRVVRDGKTPTVIWLDLDGYIQGSPLWRKIPATMIEKCARVAGLRKAYPSVFGGVYIPEEMPASEPPAELPAQTAVALMASTTVQQTIEARPAQSKTAALKEKILRKGMSITDVQPGETESQAIAREAKPDDTLQEKLVESVAAGKEAAEAMAQVSELTRTLGWTGEKMASFLKGATGKKHRGQLTLADVERLKASIDALMAAGEPMATQ